MNRSEQIDQIAAALAAAQEEIEAAPRDGRGNYGHYATLASVREACRGPLARNGIAVVQAPVQSQPGWVGVVTTLLHQSGQWLSCELHLPIGEKAGPQQAGSAITYARRYSLAAMVGVAPDDDDGQEAQKAQEAAPAQARRADDASRARRAYYRALADAGWAAGPGDDELDRKRLEWLLERPISSRRDLSESDWNRAIAHLRDWIALQGPNHRWPPEPAPEPAADEQAGLELE
jgi:hypothetical protein